MQKNCIRTLLLVWENNSRMNMSPPASKKPGVNCSTNIAKVAGRCDAAAGADQNGKQIGTISCEADDARIASWISVPERTTINGGLIGKIDIWRLDGGQSLIE
jgi:hypothetical protein